MYRSFGKRLCDLIVSGILIVLTSWLMVLILMVYVLTLNFPVFFRQSRLGKREEVFELIKFRTLNDAKGSFVFGRFLRFTSLDELPQLFQIWSGRMSLVGPRPLPVAYRELYSVEQRRRHAVLPGITGWAQVNGRHSVSWQRKFELDVFYVDHVSIGLDARIILKTMGVLLSFHKDRSLEEAPFAGNL